MKKVSDEDAKEKISEKTNERSRSNRKPKGRGRGYSRREKGKGENDLSWHVKSNQLLFDSACIPWSWATGKQILRPTVFENQLSAELGAQRYNLPGICAIRTALTPGCGDLGTDPINLASQALYTDIRRELRSANQYEATDVIIYMLQMAEILAMISFCSRIYGTAMDYSYHNLYMPSELFGMQGVDYTSIVNDPAKFRAKLNIAIAKASQIWFPKGFDFLSRARWEYANYYSEGTDIKDQIYMFTPAFFRKFELDTQGDYKGQLVPFFVLPAAGDTANYVTGDDLINALNEMIDSVVGDTDFQNIAGDLFNRYGAGGVETFTLVPENMIIMPVFSIEVLEQIQNARCLNIMKDMYKSLRANYTFTQATAKAFFTVSQDETTNRLVIPRRIAYPLQNNYIARSYKFGALAPILSVHDSPSPQKTMLITRCTNLIFEAEDAIESGSGYSYYKLDVAAEWILSVDYGFKANDQIAGLSVISTGELIPDRSEFTDTYYGIMKLMAIMSSFHYHPLAYAINDSSWSIIPYAFGSQDIVAPILPDQLREINRVDLLSLFAVPDVGKVAGK